MLLLIHDNNAGDALADGLTSSFCFATLLSSQQKDIYKISERFFYSDKQDILPRNLANVQGMY